MSDRVYASIFYIALIVGSSWTAVTVGEAVTREMLTNFALLPPLNARPSRVDTFLALQEQTPVTQTAKEPLIPTAPTLTIGALAKGMDAAEQTATNQDDAETKAADAASVTVEIKAPKPRVAGWVKRLPKRALSVSEETSSHIIMRTLRAEM
ncbi:hypothetical protein [Hyphomicrobium sp.]|jgi:hypothetical protein|uniref:hypothetical protein n=1 Tax=Hyphomicrobium sp. TaxID=82 RepID=UPI0035685920